MEETAAWIRLYEELKEFIWSEPGIDIRDDSVSIDSAVRTRFYELFDAVRAAFLADYAAEELDAALNLSQYYGRVETELIETLGLSEVAMSSDLSRYLHDPFKQLQRELWDPLFDLLQGRLETYEEFEAVAKEVLSYRCAQQYVRGYEKWAQLALVRSLQPAQVFEVPLATPTSKQFIRHQPDTAHSIPAPQPSDRLAFDVRRRAPALVPDFIVQSRLLGRYVGIITAVGRGIWKAGNRSSKREWLDLADLVGKFGLVELDPTVLIYIDDEAKDLNLVADSEKICRPDVLLDVTQIDDWTGESAAEYLQKVHLWHTAVRPTLGTFVMARHPVPPELAASGADSFHIMKLGFESFRLEPLVDAMRAAHGHDTGRAACRST